MISLSSSLERVKFEVCELCDIRDGVKQCDYFDNDEISILLTSLCTD